MAIVTNEEKELAKKAQTTAGGNGLNTAPATSGVEDFSGYLQEMNAAKQRAAVAGLEAAYQKNVASVDRAREKAAVGHQNARNQTAGASEQAKRNFAQYAAASGLNSGTGGQAELARSVALQNNLNAINQQEAGTMADLDLQRAQLEIDYNNAIAQAQAEGDYELANALYQEKVRVQDATREEKRYREQFDYTKERDAVADSQYREQFDYTKERDAVADSHWQQQRSDNLAQQEYENLFNQQKYADSKAQQEWQNNFYEQQRADTLAQQEYENLFNQQKYTDSQSLAQQENLAGYGQAYLQAGIMPSAEMLAAMGITEADAQAYITALQGGGTGSGMSFETAKQAIDSGVVNDQVLSVLRANGYTDDMLAGIYGYEAPAESGTIDGKTVAEYDAAAGNYASVKALADGMKTSGSSTSEITAMLKEAWESGALNTNDYMSLVNKYRG